jgi:hypothetical protein
VANRSAVQEKLSLRQPIKTSPPALSPLSARHGTSADPFAPDEIFVFTLGCTDLAGGGAQLDVATRPLGLPRARRRADPVATVAQELGLAPRQDPKHRARAPRRPTVAAVEKLRLTEVSLAEEVEKAPARLRARGRSRSGSWTTKRRSTGRQRWSLLRQ